MKSNTLTGHVHSDDINPARVRTFFPGIMTLPDHQLTELLKSGNESAFRSLVASYQDKVVNTCFGFLHDEDDAKDAAQEVFMEIHRSVPQFKGESKLSTWIYRIAVTKSLEHIRKRDRKKRFGSLRGLLGLETDPDELENTSVARPDENMETDERKKVLLKHVHELSESQRTAVVMLYFEELSYQEIADVMQTTVSSVESLLFRARQNLKKRLGNFYENQ